MLYPEEKVKWRPRYFKMLKNIGWKVVYDDNPNLDHEFFDISVFLMKNEDIEVEDKDGNKSKKKKTSYGFFQTTYNSDVSYDEFAKAWVSPDDHMAKLVDIVHSRIYPFDLDDVIAQLLHLGHHIQDVYKVEKNGKLNLHITPPIIHDLIHQFCTQNSPLLNPGAALRPKKLGHRTMVRYENPDIIELIKKNEGIE